MARGHRLSESLHEDVEPTLAELAAIEAEWPGIAAELAELDREIAHLSLHDLLDQAKVRRARRVTRAALPRRVPVVLLGTPGRAA